jgi:hypothetical protein
MDQLDAEETHKDEDNVNLRELISHINITEDKYIWYYITK